MLMCRTKEIFIISLLWIIRKATAEADLRHLNMDDSKDTVIITGIGKDTSEEDFLLCFTSVGNVQKTTLRGRGNKQEGIVTYTDPAKATEAVRKFNDEELKGNVISVRMAEEFYNHRYPQKDLEELCRHSDVEEMRKTSHNRCNGEINTAWNLWTQEGRTEHTERKNNVHETEGLQEDERQFEVDQNCATGNRGGRGGKGGDGFWGLFKGQDGQPGEDGPGGRGGKGGKGGGWL